MNNKSVWKTGLMGMASAALLGLTSSGASAADIPVKVMFDADSCPIGVDNDEVVVTRASRDKVVWTAHNADGSATMQVQYSIYFDPFRGRPLADSNSDGVVTSPPVDAAAPEAQYKYTVLAAACPQKPFDPRIRLR
jgi:hypothetical protein